MQRHGKAFRKLQESRDDSPGNICSSELNFQNSVIFPQISLRSLLTLLREHNLSTAKNLFPREKLRIH